MCLVKEKSRIILSSFNKALKIEQVAFEKWPALLVIGQPCSVQHIIVGTYSCYVETIEMFQLLQSHCSDQVDRSPALASFRELLDLLLPPQSDGQGVKVGQSGWPPDPF